MADHFKIDLYYTGKARSGVHILVKLHNVDVPTGPAGNAALKRRRELVFPDGTKLRRICSEEWRRLYESDDGDG